MVQEINYKQYRALAVSGLTRPSKYARIILTSLLSIRPSEVLLGFEDARTKDQLNKNLHDV